MYDEMDGGPTTEAIINGEKVPYDACATGDLDTAKEFYTHFIYIGSGMGLFLDGQHYHKNELHHFFKFKPKPQQP